MSRTNDEWEAVIEAKVAEVVADTSLTNYASNITTADKSFALTVDHTLLKPDATPSQVDMLCDEAIKYGFKVFGRPLLKCCPHCSFFFPLIFYFFFSFFPCFLLIYNIYHFSLVYFFCSFFTGKKKKKKIPEGCVQLTCGASDHTVVGVGFDSHAV